MLLRLTTLFAIATTLSACMIGEDGFAPPPPDHPASGGDDVGTGAPLPAGKIAVVLAHGLGGSADSFDPAIVAAIRADGHAVLRTEVPGVEGVEQRATALGPQIDAFLAETGATQVHIIAHSMGGLDARYLISSMGYASKVASLTTMSTPHRGSPLADVALGLTDGDQAAALDALVQLVGQVDPDALDRALEDLAEANAPAFNAANPDAAGVRYQSYAGFSTPNAISNDNGQTACAPAPAPDPGETRALLVLPATIVAHGTERRPNDGVVNVTSSTWTGFAGCVPADHLALTSVPQDGEGFDAPAFYKALVERLAQ